MNLNELFLIKTSTDKLEADIYLNNSFEGDLAEVSFSKEDMLLFLKNNRIVYGINYTTIEQLMNTLPICSFPMNVAKGTERQDGIPGKINYLFDTTTEVDRTEGFDFREVMRIPTVKKDEKLASLVAPTKGTDGTNVYGAKIKARPGKPALMRAGKNVIFKQEDQSYYASVQGQVNIVGKIINVHDVYEVNEGISMKTGNIDFPGTVIIRGDVPTGFTVKALGDIKIFGLVEAATIIASGSVTITEGIAGLKSGRVEAGEDVNVGYVNQGIIHANNDIFVENSIMHSQIKAINDIICQRGNIVGGVLSAGRKIIARNVGNRMNTKTLLSFGIDQKLYDQQLALEAKKAQLVDNIEKMNLLKERMNENKDNLDVKARTTLLRITHSLEKIKEELAGVEGQLSSINASLGEIENTYLQVKGTIYPNVTVMFGKYQRTIDKEYDYVTITTEKNEILISN